MTDPVMRLLSKDDMAVLTESPLDERELVEWCLLHYPRLSAREALEHLRAFW
jgi:hypothetical protein